MLQPMGSMSADVLQQWDALNKRHERALAIFNRKVEHATSELKRSIESARTTLMRDHASEQREFWIKHAGQPNGEGTTAVTTQGQGQSSRTASRSTPPTPTPAPKGAGKAISRRTQPKPKKFASNNSKQRPSPNAKAQTEQIVDLTSDSEDELQSPTIANRSEEAAKALEPSFPGVKLDFFSGRNLMKQFKDAQQEPATPRKGSGSNGPIKSSETLHNSDGNEMSASQSTLATEATSTQEPEPSLPSPRKSPLPYDVLTSVPSDALRQQQLDRSKTLKGPMFLPRDQNVFSLQENKRNGSFVTSILGNGRAQKWSPELANTFSSPFNGGEEGGASHNVATAATEQNTRQSKSPPGLTSKVTFETPRNGELLTPPSSRKDPASSPGPVETGIATPTPVFKVPALPLRSPKDASPVISNLDNDRIQAFSVPPQAPSFMNPFARGSSPEDTPMDNADLYADPPVLPKKRKQSINTRDSGHSATPSQVPKRPNVTKFAPAPKKPKQVAFQPNGLPPKKKHAPSAKPTFPGTPPPKAGARFTPSTPGAPSGPHSYARRANEESPSIRAAIARPGKIAKMNAGGMNSV